MKDTLAYAIIFAILGALFVGIVTLLILEPLAILVFIGVPAMLAAFAWALGRVA